MNELIEELFEQYASERRNDISVLFTDFVQAIETACKAQRNACARVYYDVCKNNPIPPLTAVALIKHTEIERQDYE